MSYSSDKELKFEVPDNVIISNEDETYSILAGLYWDPFSEMFPFATDIVYGLVEKGDLKGKTLVNLISSQYSGIKTIGLDNKNEPFMNVIDINTPELEEIKNNYLRYADTKICNKYDNVVCAIIDDPTDTDYTNSDCYIKNTILIVSKDKSYIINIGYPSKKVKELETDDFVKKLVVSKKYKELIC